MPYCTSCGLPIPEGQGSSCSMCFGDIAHGKDGYYQRWAEEWEEARQHREQQDAIERQAEEEQYLKDYDDIIF